MSDSHNLSKFLKRSIDYLLFSYKLRIHRFVYHIRLKESTFKIKSEGAIQWFFDLAFYILDLILIPEIYESILSILKTEYRFLNDEEKDIASNYFGNSIDLQFVRVNSQMSKRIEKKAYAYVTLNTINYRKHISKPIFLHEMMHIWQYQRFGSMYIYRALKAQVSEMKYDYGGLEGLYAGMISQQKLTNFNFEQQGSIVEDFCRLKVNTDDFNSPIVMASYEYYMLQLQYDK